MVSKKDSKKMKIILILIGKVFFSVSLLKNRLIGIYLKEQYYKKAKSIGKCVRIHGVSYIRGVENIDIGNNVHLSENAYIVGDGGLEIGDNVHISRNLVLYTGSHNYEGRYLPYDNSMRYKRVVIEKNVWIGMNVVILPGCHIKEGAIIGAGAVVAGVVEKLSVYGASLGGEIKKRNDKHYNLLEENSKYSARNGNNLHEDCNEM
jgi:acetyltransferase-like isoleucine patch superfamily enzyme